MLKELLRQVSAPDLLRRERPPLPTSVEPLRDEVEAQPDTMAEYRRLASSLGIAHPHVDADLTIERFKALLRAKDWPVFALSAVVEYMDKKAEAESAAQAGWRWRPLREKDHIRDAKFGRPARAWVNSMSGMSNAMGAQAAQSVQEHRVSASDHYEGPHTDTSSHQRIYDGMMGRGSDSREVAASAPAYDKLVPLHALRKVAAIEAEFKQPVAFFVCDYAPAPHIEYPDPFLMAVIDNPRLAQGVGRFVIDFWDEPGFGLEQQL